MLSGGGVEIHKSLHQRDIKHFLCRHCISHPISMYIAFLTVTPVDKGPSLSRYVKRAIKAVEDSGLKYQVTPMGTVIESDNLTSIFRLAECAVDEVRKEGSERISLCLKVDIRYDRNITMESKMKSLGEPNRS